MARPKHRTKPGATYFVTANTWPRRVIFKNAEAASLLVQKLFEYRERKEYQLHAYVVMPDHVHVILTPGAGTTLERAVQLIKGGSSHALRKRFPVWHSGFTEHQVRDRPDFDSHVAYVHLNPVKAKLVEKEGDYPYSSKGAALRLRLVPSRAEGSGQASSAPTGIQSARPLDPWPVASGAKALQEGSPVSAGLKPRPSQAIGARAGT